MVQIFLRPHCVESVVRTCRGQQAAILRDFRLPSLNIWELRSSGLLHSE